jgi:hypothetical protein
MMENAIGNIVGVWFVAQICLTGAAVVVWLAWNVGRLVRGAGKQRKGKQNGQTY